MTPAEIESARGHVCAALPRRIEWLFQDTSCILDFSRALRTLDSGLDIPLVGARPDPLWADHRLFGEERHDGGAAPFYTLHLPTSEVCTLDVEADTSPVLFLNSSVAHFVASIQALDRVIRGRETSVALLAAALGSIDPDGYPRSRWRDLVDYLSEEPDPL